jgi:hypothetical protein
MTIVLQALHFLTNSLVGERFNDTDVATVDLAIVNLVVVIDFAIEGFFPVERESKLSLSTSSLFSSFKRPSFWQ